MLPQLLDKHMTGKTITFFSDSEAAIKDVSSQYITSLINLKPDSLYC